ncbi:oligosaccharide flippase family protein [Streptococcus iners]|uniref:Oligosaccharide flippase family protein n=1 Tax=Streptococcus iners TaxID=3028084 RepID=A0AA96VND3_9STRE|nr:oligosaccharide flippase family protein [Streptococcus sp. 29887]MCK3941609.1 oligosaccharide flippase family protein [Streptococcus suis]MCK4026026.1 oligosaccharide flippase family protein [Streptococcus suis]WNY51751.1 oligosaccharide flippase family protein [Streptococcus sp. 29887]
MVKSSLFKNTVLLYLLKFSTVFFSMITIPLQARVLGVSYYGELGIATALMTYFTLFIDFGFTISATGLVSKNRNNPIYITELFWSVSVIKLLISVVSIIFLWIYLILLRVESSFYPLYIWFLIAILINGFLPDFVFRGLEKMQSFTYRTIFIRLIFTLLLFIFLKTKEDLNLIPVATLIGNALALVWALIDLNRIVNVFKYFRFNFKLISEIFLDSVQFFISRIVSVIYSSAGIFILGVLDPSKVEVGYYSFAFRIAQMVFSIYSPIADSLYPYLIRTKDLNIIYKILKITIPALIIISIICFIFIKELTVLIFGIEYIGAIDIIISLIPSMILMFPNYLLGFPALSAINREKYANISIFLSFTVYVLLLLVLWICHRINPISLGYLFSLTTIIEVIFRALIIKKYS